MGDGTSLSLTPFCYPRHMLAAKPNHAKPIQDAAASHRQLTKTTRPPGNSRGPLPSTTPKLPLPDAFQPKTGRPCLVCSHPDHDEIDAALVQNSEKVSKLSARFKVSIGSLQRHRESHLPARLLNTAGALQAAADAEFVRFAVTQSASRLRRIQTRADQLESIRAARAAAADPAVPGADTGLLVTRRRSIRTGKDEYELVQDVELDRALLAEERALVLLCYKT